MRVQNYGKLQLSHEVSVFYVFSRGKWLTQ